MKIIFSMVFGCLSLTMNTFGHAGTLGSTPYLDQGFYLGGNIGIHNLNDKESTTSPPAQHQLGATGILGGGLLGYDFNVNEQLTLGAEWFMNAVGNSVAAEQFYTPVSSYTAKMRYEIGARLLPSYILSPRTRGHLILGYSNGNFTLHDNGDFGFIDKQFSQNGFQVGLGAMTSLLTYRSFFLRGDLIYTIYAANTALGIGTQNQSQTYENNFSTLTGNLTLTYKFSS